MYYTEHMSEESVQTFNGLKVPVYQVSVRNVCEFV